MKKYVIGLVVLSLFIIPSVSFAQAGDIDPNPVESDCISLQSSGLRYRARDVNTNQEVSLLQDFLQSKNYLNSEPTGYFGLLTLKAVKDFQKANGISPTGYVGTITKAKIKALTCEGGVNETTPSSGNPVISGVSGPLSLNVGQQGIWKVSASSPSGGNLTYSVDWGDQGIYGASSAQIRAQTQQTATFTHTYTNFGTYTPTFIVTSENTVRCFRYPCPSNVGTAKTSLTVNVGNTVSTPSITLLSPNGGENYTAGQQMTVKWNNISTYNTIDQVTVSFLSPNFEVCQIASIASSNIDWTFIPYGYKCLNNSKTISSGQYKVQLSLKKNGEVISNFSASDTSDNYFTISSSTNSLKPVVTVTASSESITSGGSSTISWSATNDPTSCYLSDGGGVSATGSKIVYPTKTTTYTVNCSNSSGTGAGSINVEVKSSAVPVVTVTASPESVSSGQSSTISWSATNGATVCYFYTGEAFSGSTGSKIVYPIATKTYSVTCYNSVGGTAGQKMVTVSPEPVVTSIPVVTVTASLESITSGGSSTISWSATNDPTSCYLSDGGGVGATGSKIVYPTKTTTYTVNCSNSSGTGIGSTVVNVATQSPVPVVTVSASPESISAGDVSRISWSATNNATHCYFNTGEYFGGSTGSKLISTTYTKSYSVTCYNSAGGASGRKTVTISSEPVITSFTADPASVESGRTSTISWSSSNTTSCVASDGTYSGTKPTSGSMPTGVLTSTKTFTLTCSGQSGTTPATKSLQIKVVSRESANALSALESIKITEKEVQVNSNIGQDNFSTPTCREFTKILSKGMNDSEVKCLQKILNQKGFRIEGVNTGEETNYFGYATLMALKKFQTSTGLTVDGIFGPATSEALLK